MDRVQTYPTFAHDGTSLRRHSLDAAIRLEAQRKVRIQRSKSGEILSLRYVLRGRPAQTRLILRLRMGTKYSFQQHVGTGYTWTLKPLPYAAVQAQLEHMAQPEQVNASIRDLFSAVLLSVAENESAGSKVLSIDRLPIKVTKGNALADLHGAA